MDRQCAKVPTVELDISAVTTGASRYRGARRGPRPFEATVGNAFGRHHFS